MGARRAFVVAGLGFGDEGKGSIVDFLVRRHGASAVVRANGGPQAAHHVVEDDGRTHCASQLGAGVLVPGVRAHLARTTVVDPLAILAEDAALRAMGIDDGAARLTVDPRAIVVTPFHCAVNQMQELARGDARHGSCGRGVAQAQLDAERGAVPSLRASDLREGDRLRAVLSAIWLAKVDLGEQIAGEHPESQAMRETLAELRRHSHPTRLAAAYAEFVRTSGVRITATPDLGEVVVVEGAQGVLLDREHGFWPHVTPSRTTFGPGLDFLREAGDFEVKRLGVIRAYATRHGAGPFVTEDAMLTRDLPDLHNGNDRWQGAVRVGGFDAPATRYALAVCAGADAVAVTNVDRLRALPSAAVAATYDDGSSTFPPGLTGAALTRWWSARRPNWRSFGVADGGEALVAWIESPDGLDTPVAVVSHGPSSKGKIERRALA